MHINQFTVDKRLIGMYFKYPWGSLGFLGVKRRTGTQITFHKTALIYIGHTSCHAQCVYLDGGSSLTGGGSKIKCKLQKACMFMSKKW